MNTLLRAALLLTTSGSVATSQAARTVVGCVVDNVTKQPLTQVSVTVLGRSATTFTDSLGFFILRGMDEPPSLGDTSSRLRSCRSKNHPGHIVASSTESWGATVPLRLSSEEGVWRSD